MQKRIEERGKVMINFEIDPDTDNQLQQIANKTERSKSALIRYIIKEFLGRVKLPDIHLKEI